MCVKVEYKRGNQKRDRTRTGGIPLSQNKVLRFADEKLLVPYILCKSTDGSQNVFSRNEALHFDLAVKHAMTLMRKHGHRLDGINARI